MSASLLQQSKYASTCLDVKIVMGDNFVCRMLRGLDVIKFSLNSPSTRPLRSLLVWALTSHNRSHSSQPAQQH